MKPFLLLFPTAFNRCRDDLNPQETCNSIYGFAILDASWGELSLTTQLTALASMFRNHRQLDHQEVANVMYSLALISFDFDSYGLYAEGEGGGLFARGLNMPVASWAQVMAQLEAMPENGKINIL